MSNVVARAIAINARLCRYKRRLLLPFGLKRSLRLRQALFAACRNQTEVIRLGAFVIALMNVFLNKPEAIQAVPKPTPLRLKTVMESTLI